MTFSGNCSTCLYFNRFAVMEFRHVITELCSPHLGYLDLEGGVRVAEVGLEVFDSLISAIETISTTVAVPVGPLEPLLPFNGAHNLTVIAASKDL